MQIERDKRLAEYTTFKIGGPARFFCHVLSEDELVEAVRFAKKEKLPVFVLGGGSNVLISDTGFRGLVVKIEMMGVEYGETLDGHVLVKAAAGELWDGLVASTVERGLSGLENLSAIPGTVGAAPIQNIGAYGAEAGNTIVNVRAFDTRKMAFVDLARSECKFAYRDSIFKHKKGRYIVTRVDFRLEAGGKVNVGYKDVKEYFAKKTPPVESPTLRQVREAVVDIRWNKLPDWKLWGTAGSFFKNPVISIWKYGKLKKQYPGMPSFPAGLGRVKVPLGWILDNVCNVKGFCIGEVCVYEKQALVIVAKPGATSAEVVSMSQELMKRVKDKTGIDIEGEVEWVN